MQPTTERRKDPRSDAGPTPVVLVGAGRAGSRWRQLLNLRWLHFVLLAVLATMLSVVLHLNAPVTDPESSSPLHRIDDIASDSYFRWRGSVDPRRIVDDLPNTKNIVLIETPHQLPRPLLTKLLDKLSEAKVVAFDLMFVDNAAELNADEKPYYQSELKEWQNELQVTARAVHMNGRVIIGSWPEQWQSGSEEQPEVYQGSSGQMKLRWKSKGVLESWEKPAPKLWDSAEYRAHLVVTTDTQDGVVRTVPLFEEIDTQGRPPERVPCLGLAIAAAVRGVSPKQLSRLLPTHGFLQLGSHKVKVGNSNEMTIDYLGDRKSFEQTDNHEMYTQALAGPDMGFYVDKSEYKDKIVIIGEVSKKSKEFFSTPFGSEMPGMQIHADVAATLLSDLGAPIPTRLITSAFITLLFSLLLVAPLGRWPLAFSFVLTLGLMIGVLGIGFLIFEREHRILPASMPIAGLFLTIIGVTLYEYQRVRQTLGRFIGTEMVGQTLHTFVQLRLGGRSEVATAFFCDMRGYSALTETMNSVDLAVLMNEYTDMLVRVVRRFGGRPIDYQGDGVFVLFEKEFAGVDFASQAVRAALTMQQEFALWREAWHVVGEAPIEIGIGLDTGEMMIGAVGSTQHMKMGAIGDAVNVASRIQRMSRECGYNVLLTRRTVDLIADQIDTSACGFFQIRGRRDSVEIFGAGAKAPSGSPGAGEKDESRFSAPETPVPQEAKEF